MRRLFSNGTGRRAIEVMVFCLLMWSVLVLPHCPAKAKSESHLALAKSLVAEAGWTSADDHAAMLHVFKRRADMLGVSITRMAKAYCSMWRVDRTLPRIAWLHGLNLRGTRPEAWPQKVSWARHRGKWRVVLLRVQTFLAGRLRDPCLHDPPSHFGGRVIDDPPDHWVPACVGVETKQRYWTIGGRNEEANSR